MPSVYHCAPAAVRAKLLVPASGSKSRTTYSGKPKELSCDSSSLGNCTHLWVVLWGSLMSIGALISAKDSPPALGALRRPPPECGSADAACPTLCAKSALAGVGTSSVKGKNYRRRSKNAWATSTTSAVTPPWTCKPLWHLFVAFDMGDTGPRADLSPPLQTIWLLGGRGPGVFSSTRAARLWRSY